MIEYSAQQFRQRLAGLAVDEVSSKGMIDAYKATGIELVKALRDVFGHSLDRKTLWERISNGIEIAAKKSGGMANKFLASLLDYVKAETNVAVGSVPLKAVADTVLNYSPETQREFINMCAEYRMLLCLEARDEVQNIKGILEQTGAKQARILDDGSIMTFGEGK